MARYYELCDRLLGELMARCAGGHDLDRDADHGFFTGAARPSVPPDDFVIGAPQWHRMVGVFLALGPAVRPGRIEARTSTTSVAPCSGCTESRSRVSCGPRAEDMMSPDGLADHPAPSR